MAGVTIQVFDPVSGALDYSYTVEEAYRTSRGTVPYVATATDYDLAGEFPWQSYTIVQFLDLYAQPNLISAKAVLNDGSAVLFENDFFSIGGGNGSIDYLDRWTGYDAQGRLDYVVESITGPMPRTGPFWETTYKALDYDPSSGRLDYSFMRYLDGREQAIDYDVATGFSDYVLTNYRNGQTVAGDYNSTTGLIDYRYTTNPDGHSLSQDFDSAGRLDYELERWADGRMVVTDYDLLDQHAWSVYRIAYSAAGAIESVTVL